jgi:hypothetical protein
LTPLAFSSRDVRVLRLASLAASMAFIAYGAATSTWPVLVLHSVLLPVNLFWLVELLRARVRACAPAVAGAASTPCACGVKARSCYAPLRRLTLLALISLTATPPVVAAPPT